MYFLQGLGAVDANSRAARWAAAPRRVRVRVVAMDPHTREVELAVAGFKPGRAMESEVVFALCGGGRPREELVRRALTFAGTRDGYSTAVTLDLDGYNLEGRRLCVIPVESPEGGVRVALLGRGLYIDRAAAHAGGRGMFDVTVQNRGFFRSSRTLLVARDANRRTVGEAWVDPLGRGDSRTVTLGVGRGSGQISAALVDEARRDRGLNTVPLTGRLR